MKFETGIPEKDRVCINCIYFGRRMDCGDEYKCNGTMPCSNYHKDNTQNYFVPDDWYLQTEYGCEVCKHFGDAVWCKGCSRWYENLWEREEQE